MTWRISLVISLRIKILRGEAEMLRGSAWNILGRRRVDQFVFES